MTEEKSSLLGHLIDNLQQNADKVFCREMDDSRNVQEYTYSDLMQASCNLGRMLKDEDTCGKYVPLFLDTSFDFLRALFGVMAGEKVCVPLHTIANEDAITHILGKIKAVSIVVLKPSLYQKLVSIDYVHKHIHTIYCSPEVIDVKALPCRHVNIYETFEAPLSKEEGISFLQDVTSRVDADDPMQIVFTSGTTGEPKGAVLTHRNLVSCIVRAGNYLGIDQGYRTLTFLPLSHVMAQNEVFIAFVKKAIIQIVGRDNLLHALRYFEPNILVAVPRVYQAIYDGVQRKLRSKPRFREILNFSVRMHTNSKHSKKLLERIGGSLYHNTIGSFLLKKIGKNIGRFKLLVTAGAACPTHIYEFFEAISLPLTNAQGLTEASGAIVYNEPNKTVLGSIGTPLPGVGLKIDGDGEILLKGDPIFKGYFEEPVTNRAAFTEDGWFRTGDLGKIEVINGKDYIYLQGRKKEILVLSSGHNVPAVQIEEKLLRHELIHQVMVVGDGKPRLGALIVPQDGHNNPNIREEISEIIREVNRQVDTSEKIGEFQIIEEPFTVENGMLTPTLKVRRLAVSRHYADVIGQLYGVG